MVAKKWLRYALLLFLCIWPLYSIFAAVSYRLYKPSPVGDESFDREFERYLRQQTLPQSTDEVDRDMNEFYFMRDTYVGAFPPRQREVSRVFTKQVQYRMSSPYRSQEDHVLLLNLFRPLVTCPSLNRVGNGPVSRWTCGVDSFLKRKRRCLLYAFNWNITDLSFEQEFLEKTSCTVHVFDPFLSEADKASMMGMHPKLEFHDFTVGLALDTRYLFDELEPSVKSVEEKTLRQILGFLHHRWVDVVKLDYNGESYTKLVEMLVYWKRLKEVDKRAMPFPVGQVLFQLSTGGEALQIVRTMVSLMNLGFAGFYTEPDLRTDHPWENVAFSLLNMRDLRTFNETL